MLALFSAAPALALDNSPADTGGTCACLCTRLNGSVSQHREYRSYGYQCALFDNRPCSIYDPVLDIQQPGFTNDCMELVAPGAEAQSAPLTGQGQRLTTPPSAEVQR